MVKLLMSTVTSAADSSAPPRPAMPADSMKTPSLSRIGFWPSVADAAGLSFMAMRRWPKPLRRSRMMQHAEHGEQHRQEHQERAGLAGVDGPDLRRGNVQRSVGEDGERTARTRCAGCCLPGACARRTRRRPSWRARGRDLVIAARAARPVRRRPRSDHEGGDESPDGHVAVQVRAGVADVKGDDRADRTEGQRCQVQSRPRSR